MSVRTCPTVRTCEVCKKIHVYTHCGTPCPLMKRCGSCQTGCYCSRDCQRAHWPVHRLTCKKMDESTVALVSACRRRMRSSMPSPGAPLYYVAAAFYFAGYCPVGTIPVLFFYEKRKEYLLSCCLIDGMLDVPGYDASRITPGGLHQEAVQHDEDGNVTEHISWITVGWTSGLSVMSFVNVLIPSELNFVKEVVPDIVSAYGAISRVAWVLDMKGDLLAEETRLLTRL